MIRQLSSGLLLLFTACGPGSTPTAEPSPEEPAVLEAAQAVFDILQTRDTAALRSLMLPSGAFVSVVEGRVGVNSVDQMAMSLGGGGQALLERMWDPEVRIEDGIATVWTPYDFYRDGAFSHCGIDAFQLVKGTSGDWQVASVMYTRQTEGCPPSPLGPPGN